MYSITLLPIAPFYKIAGQQAERAYRYTVTGRLEKADNLPHTAGGDCEGVQVKSARATVCKGLDLEAYLNEDGAKAYAYVIKDFSKAYVMTRALYVEFIKAFGTVDRESDKNGGGVKIRLKHESKAMLEWLRARA
jgi:hypothetical protein